MPRRKGSKTSINIRKHALLPQQHELNAFVCFVLFYLILLSECHLQSKEAGETKAEAGRFLAANFRENEEILRWMRSRNQTRVSLETDERSYLSAGTMKQYKTQKASV